MAGSPRVAVVGCCPDAINQHKSRQPHEVRVGPALQRRET